MTSDDVNFHHPFEHPYQVQLDLMKQIYDTLKNDDFKLGIFESPTGTGKTLSLICSTMTWLREYKKTLNDGIIDEKLKSVNDPDDDEPEWVKKSFQDKILNEYLGEAKKYEQHLQMVKDQGFSLHVESENNKGNVRIFKKRKSEKKTEKNNGNHDTKEVNIDDLAPDDYDISAENIRTATGFSKDVEALLNKVEGSNILFKHDAHATKINESKVKIFFVSRTHSQLSQFSSQLKLTDFPSSIDNLDHERIKYLPMGSRKQLCINESVYNLNDLQLINKACQNLQSNKSESEKCKFMPKPFDDDDISRKNHLNDLIMSDIYDIEDIHTIGEKMNICPYYSTRNDIPIAEIISMPYQLLLHKDTRQILGFDLKNSIIVIDEAHNLLDTISRIYSSLISFNDLKLIKKSLKLYTKKFMFKMSAGNRINIAKLNKLINILYKFISKSKEDGKIVSGLTIDRNEIFGDEITDLLNVFELENYLIKSKLAFKLESYMEKIVKTSSNEYYKSSGQPLLFGLKSFLYSLSNPLKSGKFFWDKLENDDQNVRIKYLLLDPSEDFKDIVEESKCVILAGGTMEPVSEFIDFLVPYLPNTKINHFSCDHVIPDSNLKVFPISNYNNMNLEFVFQKRNDEKMIIQLGNAIFKLLEKVPDGTVAFFPSYNYLFTVIEIWKKSGIYDKISELKTIFQEEKNKSVDATLLEYKKCIELKEDDNTGAFLLSVVGGKMSEGINFSDELARAVFMIGLPYPNAFSSDLVAKREYIEQKYINQGGSLAFAKNKSQEYYENLCMKAINQSVGRAIRNINDYAVIYLVDCRYENPRIQNKLSRWVKKRLVDDKKCDPVEETERFFSDRTTF